MRSCNPQAGVLDLSFTAREFVSAERATELLAPLYVPGAKTTSVRLATKSFGTVCYCPASITTLSLGMPFHK